MKFKTATGNIVEAIKFEYTVECSQALLEFGGFNIGRISASELEIGYPNEFGGFYIKEIAFEGDWIVKNSDGIIHSWSPDLFEKSHERIE